MVGSSTDNAGVEVDGAVTPVSVPVPVVMVDENGAQVQERRGRAGTLAVDEANARLRMPAPRAKDAPSFKGKNVTEFLEDLERAAETTGLDFRFLPAMVLRYCSQKVRYVVDLAGVWDEDDWGKARTYLIDRYGSNDERPETSPDILRKWTRRHGKEGKFKTKCDVERYLRKFEELANPLLAEHEIMQNEVNKDFFRGLPEPWRAHVFDKIPDGSGSRVPHKDVQMRWIRQYFEKRTLYDDVEVVDLGMDDSDDESDSDDSDDEKKRKKLGKTKKRVRFETEGREPDKKPKEKSDLLRPYNFDTELGDMTRKLEELKLSSAGVRRGPTDDMHAEIRRLNQKITEIQAAISEKNRSQGLAPPNHFPSPSDARYRCGLCGEICGPSPGAHPLGYNNCPETQALLTEGLIKRDGQRLVQADGSMLPAPTSEAGGVAQKLREMRKKVQGDKGKSAEFIRETPPHMVRSNFTGLLFDGQEVLSDGAIGIVSEEYTTNWESFVAPATRTEKTTNCHDPKKRKEKKDESIPTIRIPKTADKTGGLSKSVPGQTSGSTSKPPIQNMREGVKRKGKEKESVIKEIEMEDGTKDKPKNKAKSTPLFHYTSNMKETVESDRVYRHVKDTLVTISIGTLLGLAPDLQKRFVEDLKVRREYTAGKPVPVRVAIINEEDSDDEYKVKVASAEEESTEEESEEEEKVETKVILNFDPDKITPSEIVKKYASAVRVHTVPVPLFAMITGKFQGLFGGIMATFMVDTGSELNLVPAAIHALTKLDLDLDGTHWTLKGVNGRPTPLAGCVRDAPVLLGNYVFPHHFFVNPGLLGHDGGEIILGQPWLQWFAACIQYHRNGSMVMKLWQDGDPDKGKPSVTLSLTDPKSPRNKLKMPSTPKRREGRAKIEEVSEN